MADGMARPPQDGQFRASGGVPEPERTVDPRGGQPPAIGREGHGVDAALVALEYAQLPAAHGLEEMPFEAPPVRLIRALGLDIGEPAPDHGDGIALEVPVGGVDLGDVAEPL